MIIRKIIGILLAIAGIVLLFTSDNISRQVNEGKIEIAVGQQKVDDTNSIFGMSRVTKPFGKAFTDSGQQRINAGQQEVDKYEKLSGQIKMGGYALIVIGLILILIPSMKRRI